MRANIKVEVEIEYEGIFCSVGCPSISGKLNGPNVRCHYFNTLLLWGRNEINGNKVISRCPQCLEAMGE